MPSTPPRVLALDAAALVDVERERERDRPRGSPPALDPALVDLRARAGETEELTARLVYADALSDRGDPRGEWIALSCAAPETDAGELRKRALWQRHGAAWLADDVGPPDRIGWRSKVEYRHGMVHTVTMTVEDLREHEHRLVQQPVHTLVVLDSNPALELLRASPLLARLRGLVLVPDHRGPEPDPDDLDRLFASLPALEHLYLPASTDPARTRALLAGSRPEQITRLSLIGELAPPDLAWLAGAMPRLRSLTCELPVAWLQQLLATATFELDELVWRPADRDTSLDLSALFDTASCERLARLGIGADGELRGQLPRSLRALELSPHSPTLRVQPVAALLARGAAPPLEALRISRGTFGDADVDVLARYPALHRLALVNVAVTSVGAKRLPSVAPALRDVCLDHTRVGDAGVAALAKRSTQLRRLELQNVDLGRAGCNAILASPIAPQLRALNVASNRRLNRTDVRHLATGRFDTMAALDLGGLLDPTLEADADVLALFDDGWRFVGPADSEVFERALAPSGAPVPLASQPAPKQIARIDRPVSGAIAYDASRTYHTGETIEHPQLGLGVVEDVAGPRIVVQFERVMKVLVHAG